MSLRSARLTDAERAAEIEDAYFDTPDYERLLLLDLATDLQSWPARNQVFRKALDRAARDLAKLASEAAAPKVGTRDDSGPAGNRTRGPCVIDHTGA